MQRTRQLAALLSFVPVALASAAGQERTTVPDSGQGPARGSEHTQAPVPPASALDAAAQRPDMSRFQPGVDGGSPTAYAAELDDEIPLPVPRRVQEGPDGDVVVAEASGDPFFLGFAAGPYYPPRDERVDPVLLRNVRAAYADGRPNQETFAFVMLAKRITPARTAALEALGARVLGFHPYNCVKVALPIFSIESIAAHPDVRWVGVARPAQKLHPRLVERLAAARPDEPIDVYVSLFDSDWNSESVVETFGSVTQLSRGVIEPGNPDALPKRTQSNGWQQRGLAALGVEVREYVDGIQAFRARLLPSQVERVLELDYVQFVESDEPRTLDHDFSTPLIASDNSRPYWHGGTSQIVVSGQADSGFDSAHGDLNHTWGVGWDLASSGTGAWHDGCEHGSHVAGTLLGNGWSGSAELIGNAPGLGWGGAGRHFNLKIFNNSCGDGGASMASILNLNHTAYWDGVNWTNAPMVLQNSWGTSAGATAYIGTEADARLLDDEVYFRVQDYVFSSGNSGANKVGLQGGAKNVLTVGSVQAYSEVGFGNIGDLAWDSSYGPMGDSRWKPNVVAPGVNILSVDANSGTGHTYKAGTSMAAPHVSGVLAQLLDAYSWLRYSPSRADCLVMTSAVTRSNQVLTTPGDTHLRQFGTGRVDATKALWGNGDGGWTNWGTFLPSNNYMYGDFTVNPGCTRLVVCMHYKEAQPSAGASFALRNNWDLFLDQAPIDPNFNTGDWFAQQSTRDNTEIRILDNPQVGAWRWKTWPTSTVSGCDMSVTVYAYYATTTPDLTVTYSLSTNYTRPFQSVDFTGWIYNPASVASGVGIWPTLDGALLDDSLRSLADGTVAHFMDNYPSYGKVVTLGDMFPGQWKGNIWRVRWPSEGVKNLIVSSESDNAIDHNSFAQVVVDGTSPSDVTGLTSTSHTPFTWSNVNDLNMIWNPATDNLAGVAGYGVELGYGAPAIPSGVVNTTNTAVDFLALSTSPPGGYYVSVIAVDNSGNLSSAPAVFGPVFIDIDAPTTATNVASTSHAVGAPSCSQTISMQWTDGSDVGAGVQGYALAYDHSPTTDLTGAPPIVIGLGNTTYNGNVGASAQPWYFHIATVDWAGNYAATVHAGPYYTSVTPTTYCVPKLNSLGCYPDIGYSGTSSASATSGFMVYATEFRNNKPGILLYSVSGADSAPFQGGTLCVLAPVKRSVGVSSGGLPTGNDCSGMPSIDMNAFGAGLLGGAPHAALRVVGTNVWCQWWGRDPGFAAPNNSSLSNGLRFTVCN